MEPYYLDNGIPLVDFDVDSNNPWSWSCPVCEYADRARDESAARHAWFDHVGPHDLVATWPDTADIEVPEHLADTRIRTAEQAAMSARPSSRPTP